MHQKEHAESITSRFKEVFEQSGESFSQEHYDELVMLIEAGLDSALYQQMEKVADQLTDMAQKIRHNAEFDTDE